MAVLQASGMDSYVRDTTRKRLFDTTEESSHKKIPDTEKAVFNLDNLKPDVVREMTGFIDIFDLI